MTDGAAKLFDQICDRENLRSAFHLAMKGKRNHAAARAFAERLDENLASLADQLRSGTLDLGRHHQFVIRDPKERIITAPCFPERVLHQAIMRVCEPVFERWLIDDTDACRRGKGRIAALLRTQQFARNHRFFLKLDIRKYFDSVPHGQLLVLLGRLFKDRRLLSLFEQILSAFRGENGHGLPIGSLTSQHFANACLGQFDRFVKERLRIRRYVRYMDDMALWGASSPALRSVLQDCAEYLELHLRLSLKETPYTNRVKHGMDFLGSRVFAHHMVPNRRSRVRFRKRMRELEAEYQAVKVRRTRPAGRRVRAGVRYCTVASCCRGGRCGDGGLPNRLGAPPRTVLQVTAAPSEAKARPSAPERLASLAPAVPRVSATGAPTDLPSQHPLSIDA